MIPLCKLPRIGRFIDTERQIEVIKGWRGGNGVILFNGYRASVWDEEKFWKWIVVMYIRYCECT